MSHLAPRENQRHRFHQEIQLLAGGGNLAAGGGGSIGFHRCTLHFVGA